MVFSSVVFLFLFLPIVFILYTVLPTIKIKNIVLIIASLLFYAYGEPRAVILMIASIFVNYGFALLIERDKNKFWLSCAIIFNVFLLFIFKYLNFFVDSINTVFGSEIYLRKIHLPIGISFFTFQTMSYVIDVYRGQVKAQKKLYKLMLYISFFPQLIAGPIIKYHDIEKQLDNRSINIDKTASGLRLFMFGLAGKLLIANTMGSVADSIFSKNIEELYPTISWIGAVAYTMQIYFDFSGYSNMAIGLGRMFGFEFAENFNLPFISKGIKEFWRRWHISLSTWFKEYVYIPLGGNRKGRYRTALNQLIVFTLTGLWHGANVTFLVWGLLHGIFLVIESLFKSIFDKMPKLILHIYTMLVVILTFVIFRADSIGYGIGYITSMFNPFKQGNIAYIGEVFNYYNLTIFVIGVLLAFGLHKKVASVMDKRLLAIGGYGLSVVLCVLCIINISAATYNPFIYFRF